MSKYIIDTEAWANLFEVQRVGVYGIGDDIVTDEKTVWSRMFRLDELEELNSDYINEHFGNLQDEAYQRGFEDGKKSVSDPDRIEVGDEVRFLPNDRKGIVTACHVPDVYAENDKYAVFCGTTMEYVLRQHITKTGKHYDIQSILEAMRT